MKSRFMLLGGLLNLITLLVGFFFGVMYSGRVHAQGAPIPQVQQIAPGVTTGTFGAGLILAHEIQSDSLVVNGYDLLKINQNTLNYLATQIGANPTALQGIISNSRADKLYTIKPPATSEPSKPQDKKP